RYSESMRTMARRQQAGSSVSELLGVIMVALILLYGGHLVLSGQGDLEAADFIAYIAIFSQVMRPAKALTESFSNIHNGLAAGERVLSLMDQKSEVNDPEKPQTIGEFKESICLRNVSFSYESTPVLKGVNLEIKKGETVALVGPSGAGKSTLMDLIPRFMDVTSGEVLFDGIDVRQLSHDELRSHIGLVNQESILFNDSIFNNIAFAHPETMLQEVQEAAKIANAHEFIDEMPEGYHTNIG